MLGLEAGWRAVARLGGPLQGVAQRTESSRMALAERRNRSLYAHGTRPVSLGEYEASRAWLHEAVLPDFVKEAFGG